MVLPNWVLACRPDGSTPPESPDLARVPPLTRNDQTCSRSAWIRATKSRHSCCGTFLQKTSHSVRPNGGCLEVPKDCLAEDSSSKPGSFRNIRAHTCSFPDPPCPRVLRCIASLMCSLSVEFHTSDMRERLGPSSSQTAKGCYPSSGCRGMQM
jgi:hypothetical protein